MKKSVYLLFIFIFFNSCSKNLNSTHLNSENYNDKKDRIEILKKEINQNSEILDAEFELFNVNGFSDTDKIIPGASSWDYKIAIKIYPSDIFKWTNEFKKSDTFQNNINWTKKIVEKRKENWLTYSNPEFYYRNNSKVEMIVFKEEGIIYKRIIAN